MNPSIHLRFAIVICCLSLSVVYVGRQARSKAKQVYILTGQSNSLGTISHEGATEADWSPVTDPGDEETDLFWSNVSSVGNTYPPPLHPDSRGEFLTLRAQPGGGSNPVFWGPEFGFARQMYAAGRRDIAIIKVSRGGGGNGLWDRDNFRRDPPSGQMWGHLHKQLDIALAKLSEESPDFHLRGLIYLQGESNSPEEGELADSRLEALVNNLKAHIENRFPHATEGWHTVICEIAASKTTPPRRRTTALQRELAKRSTTFTFVETSDLPLKSDAIHFGKNEKLIIGTRVANAFLSLSDSQGGNHPSRRQPADAE